MSLAPGWIRDSEISFHEKYMTTNKGRILEGGAFGGRLFSYLHLIRPKWSYIAVCAWSKEHTYIPVDNSLDYWEDENIQKGQKKNLMTVNKFLQNCPFAKPYNRYFEDFQYRKKFDIVSMGQISDHIDWHLQYQHAKTLVKEDGIIIARHLQIDKHKSILEYEINKHFDVIDYSTCGRNAALRIRK